MSRKVTIIGAGSVGATIAYTMAVSGTASEVVLIDINTEKALGEAMDIRQGVPFRSPIQIYAGGYSDAVGSDIVIITSGMPRKPGQSRIDLAQFNVDVMRDIAPKIVKYAPNAVYVLISNPVDILTYAFLKFSGLPERQVLGSGTLLDTVRLRSRLAEHFAINQQNIHAYVLGEHGDSSFIPWSIATISSISLEQYCQGINLENVTWRMPNFEEIEKYVRSSGGYIISCKGATYYAIATAVCRICECLFSNNDTILTVSTMMHGEFGLEDVCLSLLAVVGAGGVRGRLTPPLTPEEVVKLRKSADTLKDVISKINI